jgi:hypothetical protein
MVVESELKITDVTWNDNLTNPESEMYQEMQDDLEEEMNVAFCNEDTTLDTADNDATCSVAVTGFTEGSVNVEFEMSRLTSNDSLPSEEELLGELQDRITKKPMKKFAVDKKSLKISKYLSDKI